MPPIFPSKNQLRQTALHFRLPEQPVDKWTENQSILLWIHKNVPLLYYRMDVSICLAGFRTPRWTAFLDSIKESCKKYTYEVIIAGPFEPPTNLPIKFIKTYACPSTA